MSRFAVVMTATLVSLLASCGGDPTPKSTLAPAPTPTSTLAQAPTPASTLAPAPTPNATSPVSEGWAEHTAETASYRVLVRTGPTVSMGVMQQGSIMTMMDMGRPVNHHFEVHLFDKASGTELKNLIPEVIITDPATGASRGIPNVQACLLANHRVTEPHFGDNLYISDGVYPVSVVVGGETGLFESVVIPMVPSRTEMVTQ